ncbi:MAG: HTH-type transcriptional regulator NimR [Pseudomonas citronellolis]|nr:MAG: HTH-type transcriptional regulator NimR [Pseudomonas citronellolis]
MNGQTPDLRRAIPQLDDLPRPVYARAERLRAGSWTGRHHHAWVQLSYAITGVLGVHTAAGSFFAPPQRAIWIPAYLEHEVVTSGQAEMRSLYLRADACTWAPARCHVLEVSPLARELIKAFCALPVDYPQDDSAEQRLVGVLLDQLRTLPEVAFSLPMPQQGRLLQVCQALLDQPTLDLTLGQWAQRLGTSEKTLSRLFQRETGMTFRLWRQRQRLLASLSLLEAGTSVTATALDCGYDSTSAYIAAFKGLFGYTPGELFKPR